MFLFAIMQSDFKNALKKCHLCLWSIVIGYLPLSHSWGTSHRQYIMRESHPVLCLLRFSGCSCCSSFDRSNKLLKRYCWKWPQVRQAETPFHQTRNCFISLILLSLPPHSSPLPRFITYPPPTSNFFKLFFFYHCWIPLGHSQQTFVSAVCVCAHSLCVW